MEKDKSKNNNQITLGSDPEVFLYSTELGVFFPAFGVITGGYGPVIHGDKELPFQIIGPGFSTQVDNVMCEYNIPPSSSEVEFSNNIQKVMDWLKENLPAPLVVKVQPSAEFTDEMLASDEAHIVGCSADYSAYTGDDVSVGTLSKSNFRFAGGHIHVGYPNPNFFSSTKLIKWMDIFLGLPSVILDHDERRKAVYGTPGRWRDKEFGLEYRVLSNWWTEKHEYRIWVFRQVEKAYYAFIQGVEIGKEFEEQVFDCISKNNAEQARILMRHFDVTDELFTTIFNMKLEQYATADNNNQTGGE